jgi:ssDNA-binding Zn-finger/Zn-ribbon topoisomerase 1
MIFNRGYLCPQCGPIPAAKSRTIKKIAYKTCPGCERIVTEWERPLNERAGRCGNCGQAAFSLKVVNGHIHRKCKNESCQTVFNVDLNVIVEGG